MRPPSKAFWAVVGVAFALRALLLLAVGSGPSYAYTSDSPSYYGPAQYLRAHGAFATEQAGRETPELYRTPGYPVFLLPFLSNDGRTHHRAVQWAQVILNSFSAGLVYLAALHLWPHKPAALAAGMGFALDFVNGIHCLFVLTDILFVFALTVTLWLLIRKQYVVAGLVTSLAVFVRPIGLYYPGFLALLLLVYWIKQKDPLWPRRILLFLAVSLMPLLAWAGRNRMVAGHWTFSTIQDANVYVVRAALIEMEQKKIPYESAVDAILRDPRGAAYFREHWREYTKIVGKDVIKLLTGNSMKVAAWAVLKDDHYDPSVIPVHSQQSPLDQAKELSSRHPTLGFAMALYIFFLVLVYGLALAGFWTLGRERGWEEALILASSIIYFAAITLGVDAQARYRLPIMPALFLFAGGGFQMLYTLMESRERS